MKLYTKLTLYNTLSKLVIVLGFILLVPPIIEQIANIHNDAQLVSMKNKALTIVNRVGAKQFMEQERDSVFASYNILKEEFISLEPLPGNPTLGEVVENTQRNIENEVVDFRVLGYTFKSGSQAYLLEVGKSMGRVEVYQNNLKKFAFYILLIALLVTVVVDIMFTRFLLQPFQRIEKKLKKTNHPETFDFAPISTSTVDFRYLDESINEMMRKINDAFMHERQFIANVSHELLTPISIIKNRLENILADEKLPEDAAMRVMETNNTLNRLSKIVNALLLISRIENQQFLKEDDIYLADLVNEVVSEIEDRAIERSVTLTTQLDKTIFIKEVNKYLLFTMLFNLVNNAIKYNRPNGSVAIFCYKEGAVVKLEVKDTGKGIPADSLKLLFDPLKKVKKDKSDSHGLGLPIVKTIADFHNIQLTVSSEVAVGTVFTAIFPRI